MSLEHRDVVYRYSAEPDEPLLKEGATEGWQYVWSGETGPAKARKMVAMTDAEGVVFFEPNGEWQDVTVVDDSLK